MPPNSIALPQDSVAACQHEEIQLLYSNHHGWLYAWLRKRIGCGHKAADVAQNTFLRLFSLSNLSTINEPRGFLTTTATRLMIDESRRQKVEQRYLDNYYYYHGDTAIAPSLEELVLISEKLAIIIQLLEGLPDKCQKAFLMSKFDGMRYAEIAIELGVSKGMVQQYITRVNLVCYTFTYGEE